MANLKVLFLRIRNHILKVLSDINRQSYDSFKLSHQNVLFGIPIIWPK